MRIGIIKGENGFRLESILLALYFALIPLENVLVASIGGSVNKYIGLLIIVLIVLRYLRSGKINVTNYLHILCFFCFALVSFIWSIGANNSYLTILINMTLCTLIFLQVPLRESEIMLISYSIVIAGSILAFMMLTGSQATNINNISGGRMTLVFGGLMIDNNNLAVSISICAIIAFHLFYNSKHLISRIFWVLVFLTITIAIFYTGSRGGLLAEIGGLFIYVWKYGNGIRLRTAILGGIVLLIFGIIIQNFLTIGLTQRFSIYDVIESGGTGRVQIWKDALSSYRNSNFFRQLFGYGFGTFSESQRVLSNHYVASHNDFIGILIELGFIGLILYCLVWINLFKKTIIEKNWFALSLLVVVLIGSLSIEMLIKKMLWLAWYFVLVKRFDSDISNN